MNQRSFVRQLAVGTCALLAAPRIPIAAGPHPASGRFLLAATPGIRNYLEYGGHGVAMFDMERQFGFVKRIPFGGLDAAGSPLNVKGICGHAGLGKLYLTTLRSMVCIDLASETQEWEKDYEGGCDRMAMDPKGRWIYLPSLEKDHWHVVDPQTGDVVAKIVTRSAAHNTIAGPDGQEVFLAGLASPWLFVAGTGQHQVVRKVGPFSAPIRPFTINGSQTLCFVNVNGLLGFEVGDLKTGKMLHRVEVEGFKQGPVKRHGCPSHGIAMTRDEREIWVCDAANQRLHVFDVAHLPGKQIASIEVRDQPGWVSMSLDGTLAFSSTGEIFDTQSKKLVAALADEHGRALHSEKMVEVHWDNGRLERVGNQFGIGGRVAA